MPTLTNRAAHYRAAPSLAYARQQHAKWSAVHARLKADPRRDERMVDRAIAMTLFWGERMIAAVMDEVSR